MEDHFTTAKVWLTAEAKMQLGWRVIRKIGFEMEVTKAGLDRFVVSEKKKRILAKRIDE
jgi:hypothetical protein